MANKLYREEDVRAVADAIRAKNESTETYTLSEMADAILAIESGGSVSAPLIVHSLAEDGVVGNKETYKSITIMAESVGNYAFSSASALETVELVGVTSIGREAFAKCYSLSSINIPDTVTSLGIYAFGWCTSLKSVTIPKNVISIETGAFWMCDSLTEINYEGTVAEWKAIDTNGLVERQDLVVHCTDGDTLASYANPDG